MLSAQNPRLGRLNMRLDRIQSVSVLEDFVNEYLQVCDRALSLCNVILLSPSYTRTYNHSVQAAIDALEQGVTLIEQREFQNALSAVDTCIQYPLRREKFFGEMFLLLSFLQVGWYPQLLKRIQDIQASLEQAERKTRLISWGVCMVETLVGAVLVYCTWKTGSKILLFLLALYVLLTLMTFVHLGSKVESKVINFEELERRTHVVLQELETVAKCVVRQSKEADIVSKALEFAARTENPQHLQIALPAVKRRFISFLENPLRMQADHFAARVNWAKQFMQDSLHGHDRPLLEDEPH